MWSMPLLSHSFLFPVISMQQTTHRRLKFSNLRFFTHAWASLTRISTFRFYHPSSPSSAPTSTRYGSTG